MNLENNEGALNEEILIFSERCRSVSSATGLGRLIDVGNFTHSLACLGREVGEKLAKAHGKITLYSRPSFR